MPNLSFLGRQWALASDDLPVIGFMGALFHGAWLILLVIFCVIALTLDRPKNCEAATELIVFLACLLVSTFISTFCDVLLVWNGSKGSILQPSSRKWGECVMYVLTANFLMKTGIIGYGTYLVFRKQPQCLKDTAGLDSLMQAVIISTWVIVILYICLFVASYIAFPKNTVLQWKRRIRCVNWCCCGGFDQIESEHLARMSLVFDGFFRPMNFTASDTLASLILAAKRQSFLRHLHYSDDIFPSHLITLNDTGTHNLPSGIEQCVELPQRKLTPVAEDEEMDMLEQGELKSDHGTEDGSFPEDPASFQLPANHASDPYDDEIPIVVPGHRRTQAIDFSNFNVESLQFDENFDQAETSLSHGAFSSPGSTPRNESLPSARSLAEVEKRRSPSPVLFDRFDLSRAESVESDARTDDTTLSWGDSFNGPFLVPTNRGTAHSALTNQKVDYATLERMHLYHRYALASYGAFFYLASGKRPVDIFRRCCDLFIKAAPRYLHSRPSNAIRSPQRASSFRERLDEEAASRYGIKKENIIYRSREDVTAGHLPYFVTLDYEDEAVVVAVRGTFSWSDLVTDFLIHPEPLNEEEATEVNQLLASIRGIDPRRANCLPNVSVHSGMLRSARGLINNMEKVGILEFLETGSYQASAQINHLTLPDMKDWKFVMTGHSLGAGVVSLATLLLKSRYPERKIECFAICPPGCTMSPELAMAMSPFCLSLVHGKDIVPRTSIETVERLRDQMVRAATLCRKSKMKVLLSSLLRTVWTEEELFFHPEQVDSEPLENYRRYRAAVRSSTVEEMNIAREFIPPGRIVFLLPSKKPTAPGMGSRREFEAVWIHGKDLMQEGILLSLYMIKDHFPYYSIDSLVDVMKRRGEIC